LAQSQNIALRATADQQ